MIRTHRQHALAVTFVALVAIVFGCGFFTMQTSLRGGLSVGATLAVRCLLGALALTVLLKVNGVKFERGSLRDGTVLGLLLAAIFWLQTDGLRFTTTSKSGLITSLYVPFTPVFAFLLKERVKPLHGVAALVATMGMYLLVHVPGNLWSGWNRGDFETLLAAVLCTFHVICTGRFSRRSNALVLAWTQVGITGAVSALIAIWLPAPHGFQNMFAALQRTDVQLTMAFMVCFNTVFAFWAISKWQGYLTSTEASVVYSFEPLVAVLVGVYWVGERFSPSQMVGAGLILLAMIIAELLPRIVGRRRPELSEAPAD